MLVYGKNVFNQIQNDPSSIQEVFILQNLKDQKIQKAVQALSLSLIHISEPTRPST